MSPRFSSPVIDRLLKEGRLQRLDTPDRDQADRFLADARNHLSSVEVLLEQGADLNGMFTLVYDAAVKPLRAVLANQGLRAKGGEGGHVAVVEAVQDQLRAANLPVSDVRWMLRQRNAGEYGNHRQPPVTREDIEEAAEVARTWVDGVEKVLDHMLPY